MTAAGQTKESVSETGTTAASAAVETNGGQQKLDSLTLGELKRLFHDATTINKPSRYMEIMASPHAHATFVALGGIATAYFSHSIDLPTAIYSAIAALAAWLHADSNASKNDA